MKIKKVSKKEFHLGNRLNGNGSEMRARYGLFDGDKLVGYANYNGGLWVAYKYDKAGILRPILRSCDTLAELKELLDK